MESIGDVDVVVAGLDTLDAALFAAAPHLKLVARMGVGYDRIDLKSAKEHGIAVTNTRGNNALAVAEQCLGMMLAVYRNLNDLDRCLHRGRWVRYVGRELTGKVVGLVGFGDIAQRLAKLLKGFDVQILACRKSGLPSERGRAPEQRYCKPSSSGGSRKRGNHRCGSARCNETGCDPYQYLTRVPVG